MSNLNLTEEEQELLRQIVADLQLPEPFSFKIRNSEGVPIVVEGVDEFFAAGAIRSLYTTYAVAFLTLYKNYQASLARIAELEARVGKTEEFRKNPVSPIRLSEL